MKNLFKEFPVIKGERVTLRKLRGSDADALRELSESESVYRYEPSFLAERNAGDITELVSRLYDDIMEESFFIGIFIGEEFCGLIELFGYTKKIHKIIVGYRLLPKSWGKGIATEAMKLIVDYLYTKTDIEIITASSMVENKASAKVLQKCGFTLVVRAVDEDWGFDEPTATDKWISNRE